MKRREFLQAGAALPAAAMVDRLPVGAAGAPSHSVSSAASLAQARPELAGMNVVVFITDQQRALMHFPPDWAGTHLPGATRLQQTGVTFENAFCNACMCSPSRATLLTGHFPAQHGVKYTLEENMPDDQYPQVPLPIDFPNIATVMSSAGYHVPYKGKWHMSKMAGSDWSPEDIAKYGFERWNPPDAGANQAIDQMGGGGPDNDGHYMNDDGSADAGEEGVLEFLNSEAAQQQPFFLIVSLVNPHDVLAYPSTYIEGGYTDDALVGAIQLPETVDEDLSTKPTAQQSFLQLTNAGLGPLTSEQEQQDYLNFYGNLMSSSDRYLVEILDTLENQKLLENTLIIATSDHGEMGLTHGGMRQKCFNFYEETLRVPLVYSNPKLFPEARASQALVSHVDFLPTLAGLFAAPDEARSDWAGVDYSALVLDPAAENVQDYVVFTFDDFQAGQPKGPYVQQPNHLRSIREERYKLARYFDPDGNEAEQWEMYDLQEDPLETVNLANPDYSRTAEQEQELQRLTAKLAEVEATRLLPLPNTPEANVTNPATPQASTPVAVGTPA
jgi:arylsulfatase A-like enzyme